MPVAKKPPPKKSSSIPRHRRSDPVEPPEDSQPVDESRPDDEPEDLPTDSAEAGPFGTWGAGQATEAALPPKPVGAVGTWEGSGAGPWGRRRA